MKKLLMLLAAVVGVLVVSTSQEAIAGCRHGFGYGVAYPSYSYAPVYAPAYSVQSYGYTPSYYGASYYRPGLSVVIGSGYRGYGYVGSGGGYGYHRHYHHRHYGHW